MTQESLKLAVKDLERSESALHKARAAIKEALAQPEQETPKGWKSEIWKSVKQQEQEPVAWRNAALRVGEDLCSVGPFGYYDMTAEEWLDWALSVVTVHAPPPQRTWVGLTDEEISEVLGSDIHDEPSGELRFIRAIEAKLMERNT